ELLDRGTLLLGRHFAFFGYSGRARERDAEKTNRDSAQNNQPRASPKHLRSEYSAENRRHQCAECRCVTEGHRHAERHPQISHGQAKGETAEPPQNSKYIRPEKAVGGSFVEHSCKVVGHGQCEDPWGNDPTEESTNQ